MRCPLRAARAYPGSYCESYLRPSSGDSESVSRRRGCGNGGWPDLVLMDIQLRLLDYHEATRRIKALPGMQRTPVVAGSSFAMKGDEEKARTDGCDAYVTKPYSPKQLLGLVRQLLGTT
jgi:CheY-like chemotaxis protein